MPSENNENKELLTSCAIGNSTQSKQNTTYTIKQRCIFTRHILILNVKELFAQKRTCTISDISVTVTSLSGFKSSFTN